MRVVAVAVQQLSRQAVVRVEVALVQFPQPTGYRELLTRVAVVEAQEIKQTLLVVLAALAALAL